MAFPTETVYGLGANALDEQAVARIYAAKQRPATSPLIVHCADLAMVRSLVTVWPAAAERLAARYWPGPLTLVLPKAAHVPARVTASLDTVGLRIPRHPVALELLRAAGVPIAAPSANPFTALSPTEASHVSPQLADLVLEGGPSEVGIESTVISLAGSPTLLRPGMIDRAELEAVLGEPLATVTSEEGAHASPGLHVHHYSPRTPLYLLKAADDLPNGRGAWLWRTEDKNAARRIEMPAEPAAYAQRLYGLLHELDAQTLDWIAVEAPPADAAWDGIRDRLTRARHT